jgi:hypothetical protein
MLPGADLTGNSPYSLGIGPGPALTNCTSTSCEGVINAPALQWLQLFVAKTEVVDFKNLTRNEFMRLVHTNGQLYQSLLSTSDVDLSPFQETGGKMITFHGLVRISSITLLEPIYANSSKADNAIPPQATEHYYNSVAEGIPEVKDFYRLFEVPGLGHCGTGVSGQPVGLFATLQAWVENGTVPESSPATIKNPAGETEERILCPYPEKAKFSKDCGQTGKRECWECA